MSPIQDSVVYQIWPASFQDSNGDGIGDFSGIIQRLPYLKELGITAIWLTPIFSSPSYHGYDTSNFFEVDTRYGTQSDFIRLLNLCHQNGIRVILDLVLNHVSHQHPWFLNSEQLKGEYDRYFLWKSEDELKENSWRKPWLAPSESRWNDVWHLSKSRQSEHQRLYPNMKDSMRPVYYYGVFGRTQVDLNYEEPLVIEEIYKVIQYWLELGVDGFRLDGARFIFEDKKKDGSVIQADSPRTIEFWKKLSCFAKSVKPHSFFIAEVWSTNETIEKYYSEKDCGIDASFDFSFGNESVFSLVGRWVDENKGGIYEKIDQKKSLGEALVSNFESKKGNAPLSFYSPFLSNHDQLRVSNQLNHNRGMMKALASALLTWTGVPFIYYGEEIGMRQPYWSDPRDQYDDLFKRSPMLWERGKNSGFSASDEIWVDLAKWFPWRPHHQSWWRQFVESMAGEKVPYSVESQRKDRDSLLYHYQRLIQIRMERPELRASERNSLQFLPDNGKVALYKRISSTGSQSIVVINSTSEIHSVRLLDPGKYWNIYSEEEIETSRGASIKVGAYKTLILVKR